MSFIIPDNVLDKHLAILGINGSGKTYAAKGAVERLLEEKSRVCIVDPTGVWWGLKSSESGKRGAYPVVVFGGSHADLQIGGTHGEAIAEAIGTSNTPVIIDTSLMRTGERTKFFTDFAEAIRRLNKGPLHLFIDEAHVFAPQGRVPDPQSGAMLHAANNLISLGRSRGLRVTLISQRPAKLHKDSLTQVHSLITMRLIAPQDRKAVEAWIEDQADPIEGKKIIASLPQLATGEGWIWAPENKILEKVRFPKIKTFDSSKTPDGEEEDGPVLASINLEAMQNKLAIVAKEAISNDPSRLKKRVRELEIELAKKPDNKIDPKVLDIAREEGFQEGLEKGKSSIVISLQDFLKEVSPTAIISTKRQATVVRMPARNAKAKPLAETTGEFNGPQRRIIRSLKFWRSMGHSTPTKDQVALVAGYSPVGGAFGNPIGQLRSLGIINYPSSGRVSLQANISSEEMATDEARVMLFSVLTGPEKKIISAFNGHGEVQSREEIAEKAGYSPAGGAFGNPASRLCTLGILEKPSSGCLQMAEWATEILQ